MVNQPTENPHKSQNPPSWAFKKQEAQLLLGQLTVLAVSDLQGHPRSIISITSDRAYATSY